MSQWKATCDRCGQTYPVNEIGDPITQGAYTCHSCDACGGYVDPLPRHRHHPPRPRMNRESLRTIPTDSPTQPTPTDSQRTPRTDHPNPQVSPTDTPTDTTDTAAYGHDRVFLRRPVGRVRAPADGQARGWTRPTAKTMRARTGHSVQVRTPKSFRFEPELRGGHVHVTVRAGQEGQRARLGVLIMDEDDWGELAALIQRGADWAELAGELAAVFGAAILPSGAAAPRWGPPVVDKLVEES